MSQSGNRQFLAALQLADSFFPTGMFAHSHGLESMVARGLVRTHVDVGAFLSNALQWSLIPADGVALYNAHDAASRRQLAAVVAIDWSLYAMKLPAELRAASRQSGRRILDEAGPLLPCNAARAFHEEYRQCVIEGDAPGNGAVALAVTACAAGIPAERACLMFCHSFAVGSLGAAQRLLPLTHSQAQQILTNLHSVIEEQMDRCSHLSWQDMTAFTPELDIVSILHETDEVRMFAS